MDQRSPSPPAPSAALPSAAVPASPPYPSDGRYHSPTQRGLSGGAGLPTPVHPLLTSTHPNLPLPPSTILSILSHRGLVTPVQRGRLSSVHSAYYNANPAIEDSFAVEPLVASGGALLGMFDGHSGASASVWCKSHLLHYLQLYRARGWTDDVLTAQPFLDADAHFLGQAWRDGRATDGLSGACVNVVHVRDDLVTSANAGDCRAIIGRRVDSASFATAFPSAVRTGHQRRPAHVAIPLSHDHQIDVNPSERLRLLREHAGEEDVLRRNRVKGRLQPTRGFGDGAYKVLAYYHERVRQSGGRGGESAVYRPPYTTVEPDVHTHRLTDADDFLILSTDGLFEDMDSQEAVEYVAEWMDAHAKTGAGSGNSSGSSWLPGWLSGASSSSKAPSSSSSSPSAVSSPASYDNASAFLLSRALMHASEKQIGRRANESDSLSWILRLPLAARRNVHDDVSVLVVLFDHSGKLEGDGPVAYEVPLPEPLRRAMKEGEAVPGTPIKAATRETHIQSQL